LSIPDELNLPLPYLSRSPGFSGNLKEAPEDFVVEELPLYEACGEGEHLYLCIEKRELTTPELVRHLTRTLNISQGDVGFAGRKDKLAITRQFVSLPARYCPDPSVLNTDRITIISSKQHKNKLRTGHLRGNRFQITIRDVPSDALELATNIAAELAKTGVPNYFGDQRFGVSNQSDDDGFRLLRGELTRRLNPDALRFTLSAVQSRLFNEWVRRRILAGQAHQVLTGDVLQVTASGGCFIAEDAAVEQVRCDQRETQITGPMYGPKMLLPTGEPATVEEAVLAAFDLPASAFERFSKLTSGTRRPLLIWPDDLNLKLVEGGLQFSFALPPGAYATTVLREFLKPSSAAG
jgi:tRNA pseudouridine13 synthase